MIVGDLYDRVRPEDKEYIAESRGARLGTKDFTSFQAQAREKGLAAFRAALEPARRALREQKFLSGAEAAYPGLHPRGHLHVAAHDQPARTCWKPSDPVHAWRERMLDLFDGMARKAKAA